MDKLDASARTPVVSDVPTLIINGELDHVIPTTFPQRLAKNLSKSHLYLFPGVSHSPIDSGTCAIGMVLQFLQDPETAPDSSCMEQHYERVFAVPTASGSQPQS